MRLPRLLLFAATFVLFVLNQERFSEATTVFPGVQEPSVEDRSYP